MEASFERIHLLLVSLVVLLRPAAGQGGIRPVNGDDEGVCEVIASQICENVGYDTVFVPNPRGHETQAAAEIEIRDFNRLIQSGCSNALYVFLCSYYFPLCFIDPSTSRPTKVKTCRSLCEFVRPACEPTLNSNDLPWPVFLNCSLDDFSDDASCFGPADLTNLSIPSMPISITPAIVDIDPTITAAVATTVIVIPTPHPQLPPSLSTTGDDELDGTTTNSASTLNAKALGNIALHMIIDLLVLICSHWI